MLAYFQMSNVLIHCFLIQHQDSPTYFLITMYTWKLHFSRVYDNFKCLYESLETYIYIYIYTHTHNIYSHTHNMYIYIYIYIHTYINIIYVYVYIICIYKYIYIYTHTHVYIYIPCIYMQISLNIIDILCLRIFFWIRSNSRITFIVFGGN